MFKFNRLIIFFISLFALGAEIIYISKNGVQSTEELFFEFLSIFFLFILSGYLIISIYKRPKNQKDSSLNI